MKAVYLGIEGYGSPEIRLEHAADFAYRFDTEQGSCLLSIPAGGDYALQNRLKAGYAYDLSVEGNRLVRLEEEPFSVQAPATPLAGKPGRRTLLNFILNGMLPIGRALYVYGGGWNWQDTGAGTAARQIGVSRDWERFYSEQDEYYTYKDRDGKEELRDPAASYYPFGGFNAYGYAGVDCSALVGFALYNTLYTENGKEGFVLASTRMAETFAARGMGTFRRENGPFSPGEIVSIAGHVWISLGTCRDGSVLALHSTPAPSRKGQPGGGPEISGVGESRSCDAWRLADRLMKTLYPGWAARYETALKPLSDYACFEKEHTGRFAFGDLLEDPEGLAECSGEAAAQRILDSFREEA